MNIKVHSVRTFRQMFAIIAVFAMIFSPFANVQFVDAAAVKIDFCHAPSGDLDKAKKFLDQPESSWSPSGHVDHVGDFLILDQGDEDLCDAIVAGTQCADQTDNDSDGLVDSNDPGCWTDPEDSSTYDPFDDDESNVLIPATGTLSVTKIITGDTDASKSDFSFKINGGNSINFSDSAYTVELDVDTVFNVVEDAATGFTTTYSDECSGTMTEEGAHCVVTNTVVVPVCTDEIANNTGEEGDCDYSCPQGQVGDLRTGCVDIETSATILVKKEVTQGSSTTVPFGINLNDVAQFELSAGESDDIVVTAAQSPFKVSEATLPAGWSQMSAVCTYENQSTSTPAAITLAAGDEVTCVFVNHDANIYGCMNDSFDNYNSRATVDDGSCANDDDPDPDPELCTVTVVSDTTNTVAEKDDAFAAALTFIHSAWTASIAGATWIWGDNPVVDATVATTQTFEKTFDWNGPVTDALLDIASDNSYVVSLNGTEVANSGVDSNFSLATQDNDIDVSSAIEQGENTLSIAVLNEAGDANPEINPAGLLYRLDVSGTNNDCDAPTTEDLYQVSGQVWNDENKNDERDLNGEEEFAEGILEGWLITITDGESFVATTTSDEFGNYSFMVPAGNYTVTQTMQEGWELTYPNDGEWEICVPVVCGDLEVSLFDEVMNFIIPTAHAVVAANNNALNFGNVRTPGYAQGSYGGGNGTRISLRDGGGSSDDDDDQPEGQVLGEATSTLPVGAPNTGAGGTSASFDLHVVAAILATRRSVKNGK